MTDLKTQIKKIPLLGGIATFIYRKVKPRPAFNASDEYWESRYKEGGNSGAGSYDKLAAFKAEIINDFVRKHPIESVIEFGSGDGNQLKYFHFKSYTGFDVSQSAVDRCRDIYKSDPSKQFEVLANYNGEKADLAMSLDVIYHLVEDEVYYEHMKTLFAASTKFVIIYSSNDDEHENNNVAPHVKHRKFTNWVAQHAPQFTLKAHIPNRYPYNGNNEVSSYADFYVFDAIQSA